MVVAVVSCGVTPPPALTEIVGAIVPKWNITPAPALATEPVKKSVSTSALPTPDCGKDTVATGEIDWPEML